MVDTPDDPELEDRADEDEEDGRRKVLADAWNDIPPAPLPPIAPDGGLAISAIPPPPPLPTPTPATFVCLRGPCRHLWQLETHLDSGNTSATWDPAAGLKAMKPCADCGGTGFVQGVPELAAPPHAACGYLASQGHFRGMPCRLVANHGGAHHHALGIPERQRLHCPTCGGSRVVVDPDGAPVRQPRKITRTCLVHEGTETDFTDDVVYQCNRWDPIDPKDKEHRRRDDRRRVYLKLHPEHKDSP